MQVTRLAQIASASVGVGPTGPVQEQIAGVVSRLTPEERAFWEELAPVVLDVEALENLLPVDYSTTGSGLIH